jgi:hypothetical protein
MGLIGDVIGSIGAKKAAEAQQASAAEALAYQKEINEYAKDLNQPYMDMGMDALKKMEQGIATGEYDTDTAGIDAFKAQQYRAEQYDDSGFQGLEGPDAYKSGFQDYKAPEDYRSKIQNLEGPDAYDSAFQDYKAPDEFQSKFQDLEAAEAYKSKLQDFEYGEQRPELSKFETEAQAPGFEDYEFADDPEAYKDAQFEGRDYMTEFDSYDSEMTPEERKISDQFKTEMYEDGGRRPDAYKAEDAPDSEYYDPSRVGEKEVYQSDEFRLEDDEGYQRRYKEAMRAVESSAAAKGMQLSGSTLKALQKEAAGIASQETQDAYQRFADKRTFEAGQEESQYGRSTSSEEQIKQAMQFKSADEYKRYLDKSGMKKEEQDQLISNFDKDRAFGAEQNKESFLRETASKELGRELNADEYSRWKETDGQKYAQFADERDWTTEQANLAAGQDWDKYAYEKGVSRDVYEGDRAFQQSQDIAQSGLNLEQSKFKQGQFQDAADREYMSDKDYQDATSKQYESDRAYESNLARDQDASGFAQYESQRDYESNLAQAQGQAAYEAYTSSRDFNKDLTQEQAREGFEQFKDKRDYETQLATTQDQLGFEQYESQRDFGANILQAQDQAGFDQYANQRDFDTNLAQAQDQAGFEQYQDKRDYETGQTQYANQMNYGLLSDQYNRDLLANQQQYGQMQDLVGIGLDAKSSALGQGRQSADAQGNIAINLGASNASALNKAWEWGGGFEPFIK